MKLTQFAAASIAALAAPVAARNSATPPARLTMADARAIALKKAPGRIVDAEYEKEGGRWRYSFDIRQSKRIHEIGVDANTGRIVEDRYEGLNDKD